MTDQAQVTLWHTVLCPYCENAIMVSDGERECCPICKYERYAEPPLVEQPWAEKDPKGERRRNG